MRLLPLLLLCLVTAGAGYRDRALVDGRGSRRAYHIAAMSPPPATATPRSAAGSDSYRNGTGELVVGALAAVTLIAESLSEHPRCAGAMLDGDPASAARMCGVLKQ